MTEVQINLENEEGTEQFGRLLARLIKIPFTIYLEGDLGTGKTRLSRALLHGLGHVGVVKSPTYTLVEPYHLNNLVIYHFDLYRLAEPSELDFMGIRDYFTDNALVLVEWPSRGEGFLNPQDLTIRLQFAGQGRDCTVTAHTIEGELFIDQLKQNL